MFLAFRRFIPFVLQVHPEVMPPQFGDTIKLLPTQVAFDPVLRFGFTHILFTQ